MLERLVAIEEIKQLKARYCRLIDEPRAPHEWETPRPAEQWRTVFTEDVQLDYGSWGAFSGLEQWLEFRRVRESRHHISAHHVHMPEIDITGEDTARGVWPMFDYVESDQEDGRRIVWKGYGQYHEEYRRVDGAWRISSIRLTRFRVDDLTPAPAAS